jgi:hypothetical protein
MLQTRDINLALLHTSSCLQQCMIWQIESKKVSLICSALANARRHKEAQNPQYNARALMEQLHHCKCSRMNCPSFEIEEFSTVQALTDRMNWKCSDGEVRAPFLFSLCWSAVPHLLMRLLTALHYSSGKGSKSSLCWHAATSQAVKRLAAPSSEIWATRLVGQTRGADILPLVIQSSSAQLLAALAQSPLLLTSPKPQTYLQVSGGLLYTHVHAAGTLALY